MGFVDVGVVTPKKIERGLLSGLHFGMFISLDLYDAPSVSVESDDVGATDWDARASARLNDIRALRLKPFNNCGL